MTAAKNNFLRLKTFLLAYLYSYIATVIIITIYYSSEISSLEISTILLAPFALPIFSIIVGAREPEYLLFSILHGFVLFGIFVMQDVIESNKIVILATLLTLWNLIGIYIVIQNIPSFVA